MKARTKIFNYAQLLEKLQELSPEQLQQEVNLVDVNNHKLYTYVNSAIGLRTVIVLQEEIKNKKHQVTIQILD